MENVRLRRLKADYEAVRRLVRLHPKIDIDGVVGNPPERYRLLLKVASLRERGGRVEPAAEHRLEIALPLGYPRDAPIFRMLTPVFHPNIAPHVVCIGDHWTAGEALDSLIQRVGEMLAFQSYNVQSPLNGLAARWVEENPDRVPTDREEFFIDLAAEPAPAAADPAAERCANCGAPAAGEPCAAGHRACPDCAVRCPRCGAAICLACGVTSCTRCAERPM